MVLLLFNLSLLLLVVTNDNQYYYICRMAFSKAYKEVTKGAATQKKKN